MNSILYEMYIQNFPDYYVSESFFNEAMSHHDIITEKDSHGEVIAFAAVFRNSLSLICIAEEHRGKKLGSKLIDIASDKMRAEGYDTIFLGRGLYYIFQGVAESYTGAAEFLEKEGFHYDRKSANMTCRLDTFDFDTINIRRAPAGTTFRAATNADKPSLLAAVKDAQDGWLEYFESTSSPVVIAEYKDKIVGFLVAEPDGGRFTSGFEKLGQIGYVGVIQSVRNKGFGLELVAYGMKYLQSNGCDGAELLYLVLDKWYAKLGFKVTEWQRMYEKKL
jgi:GNAT superfamily N-acetyltransferase